MTSPAAQVNGQTREELILQRRHEVISDLDISLRFALFGHIALDGTPRIFTQNTVDTPIQASDPSQFGLRRKDKFRRVGRRLGGLARCRSRRIGLGLFCRLIERCHYARPQPLAGNLL